MKAGQIKHYLHQKYLSKYQNCNNSIIADELKVCGGKAIADVAVINGKMHCFEIKSDHDSFQRLENQIINYDAVFDEITIVVGKKFNKKALSFVPKHWGVLCIYQGNEDNVELNVIRESKPNKNVNAFNIAQFLWKEEAISLLNKYNIKGNHNRKRKWLLWECLSENLQINTLKKEVRETLQNRKNWKTQSAFN